MCSPSSFAIWNSSFRFDHRYTLMNFPYRNVNKKLSSLP